MSRYRASALLASFVVTLATTAGLAMLTPGTASATPPGGSATARAPYPMPKPNLVVNKPTVRAGVTVKATGRGYARKEKVTIKVTFNPSQAGKPTIVKTYIRSADANGKFIFTVKTIGPGTAVIKATGQKSKTSASVNVKVLSKGKGRAAMTPAAFSTPVTGVDGHAALTTMNGSPQGETGVAVVALGAMALLGSAAVTRQAVRRRRPARIAS